MLTICVRLQLDVEIVPREHTGHMITWTGLGFARVRDGAGLSFYIDNIPYPMEYDILLRYEPEVCGKSWNRGLVGDCDVGRPWSYSVRVCL